MITDIALLALTAPKAPLQFVPFFHKLMPCSLNNADWLMNSLHTAYLALTKYSSQGGNYYLPQEIDVPLNNMS